MAAWRALWQVGALEVLGAPDNQETFNIITAWQKSTPLPPYSHNPLGMPAGSSGAKPFLGTPYAEFGSMAMFYDALKTFAATYTGKSLADAMRSDDSYPATWHAVSMLRWPGTQTETDYPAALLDLTSQSFRQSVGATPRPMRKTSGMIAARDSGITTGITKVRSVNQATQSFADAKRQAAQIFGKWRND